MKIETVPLAQISEYPNNPRSINDHAVDAVAASIKEFGFRVPCLLDAENVLIAGHTRCRAARKLGMESVPCVRVTDLMPAQVKALRIADNQTASIATWDDALLSGEVLDLKGLDFDLNILGFSAEEVSRLTGDDLSEASDETGQIDEQFKIIVTCTSEAQQADLLDRFAKEGLACQAVLS